MTEMELYHIGTKRHSGRYPWGSGESGQQRHETHLKSIYDLRQKGLSDKEIAQGMGMSIREMRARTTIANNELRKADAMEALRLKQKGMSNTAIGDQMGVGESQVRALLNPYIFEKNSIAKNTADILKSNITENTYLDIGRGTEAHLGVSPEKLRAAVSLLEDQGYKVHYLKTPQVSGLGDTSLKVLAAPGVTGSEIHRNRDGIVNVAGYSEDGGRSFRSILPPKHIDPNRLMIRYGDEGGAEKDGVIELRRGVDDISLGSARYAQVRIGVGGTHYLKGMAMYNDNIPDGVDLVFNTTKSKGGDKLEALKPVKVDKSTGAVDADLPFGSIVRQKHYLDKNGNEQLSVLNIVGSKDTSGEEGGWGKWKTNLSSQMLSKQTPTLAKKQLDLAFDTKKTEFEEINSLTNPTVKKYLMEKFADSADTSAVHLKAAALPRTTNSVLLPINSLKDNEIYAPQYNNGDRVVLIRHPHGGKFEIPELTVNNRNKEANGVIKNAKDAVGINSQVAKRLSGADFDGDTALVILNRQGPNQVSIAPPLKGLKDFDPQVYKNPPGIPTMSAKTKQHEMGNVSNLITDMTLRGANDAELAAAVRHSMVVIDAEKHNLNWKQSAKDNNIASLKEKYQGGANKGAATLISRAKSDIRVDAFKPRPASEGGKVDPITGKKVFVKTGESYVDKTGKVIVKKTKSTKMAQVDDAFELSSGTPMEAVYANHANKLKALGNLARKTALETPSSTMSSSAKKVHAKEVDSLNAKLNLALKNAPLERKAQLIANSTLSTKRAANPDMDRDELKKVKNLALVEARDRVGARKTDIVITPHEWDAIQAGALSASKVTEILKNTNLDHVKKLATPRDKPVMTSAVTQRAKLLLAQGYTQAEVSQVLGIPASTITSALE